MIAYIAFARLLIINIDPQSKQFISWFDYISTNIMIITHNELTKRRLEMERKINKNPLRTARFSIVAHASSAWKRHSLDIVLEMGARCRAKYYDSFFWPRHESSVKIMSNMKFTGTKKKSSNMIAQFEPFYTEIKEMLTKSVL